jgi:hypothetical protein
MGETLMGDGIQQAREGTVGTDQSAVTSQQIQNCLKGKTPPQGGCDGVSGGLMILPAVSGRIFTTGERSRFFGFALWQSNKRTRF